MFADNSLHGLLCAVTEARLSLSWAGAAAGQSRAACGLWAVDSGCLCPSSAIWIFSSWLPASRAGLTKCSFTVYIFFLLVMQCSASLDVLFLLDGSYSIGKGSFERSKHFAGKLCDALDIHPDRVSVRNISSNFPIAWPVCLKASGNVLSDIAKFNLPWGQSISFYQKDVVCEAVELEDAS